MTVISYDFGELRRISIRSGEIEDSIAIISTILNRCENSTWINDYGTNPVRQATAPGQFSVYSSGVYSAFANGKAPETVQTAVLDALNGLRNHNYLGFNSNSSTNYSNNMITSTGNRYK